MQTGVSNMDSTTADQGYQNRGSSKCVGTEPCPSCGSKDNLKRYDDGHAFCFGLDCGRYEHGTNNVVVVSPNEPSNKQYTPLRGEFLQLTKRKINEETCRKHSYSIGEYQGGHCHIASFIEEGRVVGQKIRLKGKDFRTLGDCTSLWGKHMWGKGKKIVITEGEIDCLSVSEAQNCKWPVVSIPNGVGSAIKTIGKDLEWLLENFDETILMFDMDSAGRSASTSAAELFPPGRCKIAVLPHKDVNETLVKEGASVIVDAIWRAKIYRPDGIVAGEDTWELVNTPMTASDHEYPWRGLNEYTLGARRGEIVTFCAGTGAGKSTAVKEIASYFLSKGETVGYIALEESVRQAAVDFMSIEASEMLHLKENLDKKYFREVWERVFSSGRLFLYDHFGSLNGEVLTNRIRYLSHTCGVRWIILDHISIMVSGVEGGDERRLIDNTMTNLRSLVEELNIGMFIVSHLKRPLQGKGHEDGKQVTLSDLRGSGSIAQLSDFVIGLERDQQSNSETSVRVLKARYKGAKTGVACSLYYDETTGRLQECGSTVESAGQFGQESF